MQANDVEAQLSYAYLHAVASAAGFNCRVGNQIEDAEGIDAVITAYFEPAINYRTQITINVQLKATIQTPANDGAFLSYFIQGVRRYDKLRADHKEPIRLIIVLFLPREREAWLTAAPEQLILQKAAYWASLRHAPPTANDTGCTVKIPVSQILTPASLIDLVQNLAAGTQIPEYLVP
jgi:hypothetical protein